MFNLVCLYLFYYVLRCMDAALCVCSPLFCFLLPLFFMKVLSCRTMCAGHLLIFMHSLQPHDVYLLCFSWIHSVTGTRPSFKRHSIPQPRVSLHDFNELHALKCEEFSGASLSFLCGKCKKDSPFQNIKKQPNKLMLLLPFCFPSLSCDIYLLWLTTKK